MRAVSAEGARISAPHTMHSARPLPPGLFPTRNSCSQDTCCLGSSQPSPPASSRLGLGGGDFARWATTEGEEGAGIISEGAHNQQYREQDSPNPVAYVGKELSHLESLSPLPWSPQGTSHDKHSLHASASCYLNLVSDHRSNRYFSPTDCVPACLRPWQPISLANSSTSFMALLKSSAL